jgi:hypothetical protein
MNNERLDGNFVTILQIDCVFYDKFLVRRFFRFNLKRQNAFLLGYKKGKILA